MMLEIATLGWSSPMGRAPITAMGHSMCTTTAHCASQSAIRTLQTSDGSVPVAACAQRHRLSRRASESIMRVQDGESFEIAVQKPLGIQFEEKEGVGVVVSEVYDGSNAERAGVEVGDVVIATSASIGSGMWPKTTVSGVDAAISTRIDGQVKLRLVRPSSNARPLPWQGPLDYTYEVELSQPLGLALRETKSSQRTRDVEVAELAPGGSGEQSGRIREGDVVLATSGTIGDTLWEKSSLEGVLAAISTRLAISPTVTLRMQRKFELGPWAAELHAIARGRREGGLSPAARLSLLTQRRQLRDGIIQGEAVAEAVRDLAVQFAMRTRDETQLRAMLRRMRSCGLPLDRRLANVGMGAAIRCGAPELGVAFFDRLHSDGNKADEKVFTTLIKVHAASGRMAEALAVERRMSAEEVEPTVRTYNTLMSVCGKAGDRIGMLKYFGLIGERGLRPTVSSWNVVLDYCAMQAATRGDGRVRQAEDVMRRMELQQLTPDVKSFTSLARSYIASGQAEQCGSLLPRMDEIGVAPDLRFLNTLLDGYAGRLKWDLAFDCLNEHRRRGVSPDRASYVHVVRACAGARVPSRAADAVRQMRSAGYAPDVRVYSMLLRAQAKAGKLRAALNVLKQMSAEGIKPNEHVYAPLMEACIMARQPAVALALFEQMCGSGVSPDAVTYTLLIRAHLTRPRAQPKGGEGEGADEDAASARSAAEAARLLRGSRGGGGGGGGGGNGRNGDMIAAFDAAAGARRAYEVLLTMTREGGACRPNVVTYNALIGGLVARGDLDLAYKAVAAMVEARVSPNRKTYDALVGRWSNYLDGSGFGAIAPTDATAEGQAEAEEIDDEDGAAESVVDAEEATEMLGFFSRVAALFDERSLQLHGDVYLPSLHAARASGDMKAARELLARRRANPGIDGFYPLRKAQERVVSRAEAEVEAWLEREAEDGELDLLVEEKGW